MDLHEPGGGWLVHDEGYRTVVHEAEGWLPEPAWQASSDGLGALHGVLTTLKVEYVPVRQHWPAGRPRELDLSWPLLASA